MIQNTYLLERFITLFNLNSNTNDCKVECKLLMVFKSIGELQLNKYSFMQSRHRSLINFIIDVYEMPVYLKQM